MLLDTIKKYLIHLFTVHCEECSSGRECKVCNVLNEQLEYERYQNKVLLNQIVELTTNKVEREVEIPLDDRTHLPVSIGRKRWSAKRQELEAQSRIEAQRLADLKKDLATSNTVLRTESLVVDVSDTTLERLEKELDIPKEQVQ